MVSSLLALSLALLLSGSFSRAQAPEEGEGARDLLTWRLASDPRAVCNDFTRAGFFLRRNNASDKWVIFLEGGSLCFSNDTCNRRFFRAEVS